MISGILGVVGATISLVSAFLPVKDSRELKYMKNAFDKVFLQLDTIDSKVCSKSMCMQVTRDISQFV